MRPVFILSIILLLVGCKQRDERVLMVDEQGSFAIGGTVLVDSLGHTYHGDHAYVFYQKPVGARKYPLVFAHGVGQFSKTWETTPDGREGFQNIFLRCGFSVYLVDQPRRGNAGRGTESVTISPAFDEEVCRESQSSAQPLPQLPSQPCVRPDIRNPPADACSRMP